MRIHQNLAWSWEIPVGDYQSGDVFMDCALVQFAPDTKIFEGLTGLKFIGCNLINCDIPADSEVFECNTAKVIYEEVDDES